MGIVERQRYILSLQLSSQAINLGLLSHLYVYQPDHGHMYTVITVGLHFLVIIPSISVGNTHREIDRQRIARWERRSEGLRSYWKVGGNNVPILSDAREGWPAVTALCQRACQQACFIYYTGIRGRPWRCFRLALARPPNVDTSTSHHGDWGLKERK